MSIDESSPLETRMADAMRQHREGSLTKAAYAYRKVLELDPENAEAIHLLGVIAHQLGNAQEGIDLVRRSLQIRPQHSVAWNHLGNMLAMDSQWSAAMACYDKALEQRSDYLEAIQNRANVYTEVGRLFEAIDGYQLVVDRQPDEANARLALGAALERTGQFEAALEQYRQALRIDPELLLALSRLGATYRKMDRIDKAREIYDRWLNIQPNSPLAKYFRAICDPESTPDRASPEYVKSTFDGFADEFDTCLQRLNYRVPELIDQQLQQHVAPLARGDLVVCDLGCGTGLCAPSLRPLASRLVGIDLSPAMLSQAEKRDQYDHLEEVDLVEHLAAQPGVYDLLLAADTLIYFGDLAKVVALAAEALRPGGQLYFTVELMEDDVSPGDFRVTKSGRYRHRREAVAEWLHRAGMQVVAISEAVLRDEGLEPAKGLVVVAKKDETAPVEA